MLPAASAEPDSVKEEAQPADAPADTQPSAASADVKAGSDKPDSKALVVHGAQAQQKREGFGNVVSISDLTWYTTDIEVEAACTQFGTVKTIKFYEDRSNGRSSGNCIVEFESHEQARACIDGLNKTKVGECEATVSWPSRQKPNVPKHRCGRSPHPTQRLFVCTYVTTAFLRVCCARRSPVRGAAGLYGPAHLCRLRSAPHRPMGARRHARPKRTPDASDSLCRPFEGMRGGKPMVPGMVNPMMDAMGPMGPMGGMPFMGMQGGMGPMAGHMRPMAGRGMRPGMMHGGMPGRGRF